MQNGMLPNNCDLLLLRNNGEDPKRLRPGSQGLRPDLKALRPGVPALRPDLPDLRPGLKSYDQVLRPGPRPVMTTLGVSQRHGSKVLRHHVGPNKAL